MYMHTVRATAERQEAVNKHEIRMVGMSRSGNHAIINWVLAQTPGRACYLNCVEPKTNPFESARPIRGHSWKANYPFSLEREKAGVFSPKDLLLYNHEDCFLGLVGSREYAKERDWFVGRSLRRTDVLVLRDPFNLFASRKKGIHSPVPDHTAMRIWKQHARAATSGTRHLDANFVCIRYNRWVSDRAYRGQIADALGLAFTDAGRRQVADAGGGSSFDGLRFDGKAERMDVFNRWRHFAGEADYRALFDDDVVTLTERAFAELPAAGYAPLREAAMALNLAIPESEVLLEAA